MEVLKPTGHLRPDTPFLQVCTVFTIFFEQNINIVRHFNFNCSARREMCQSQVDLVKSILRQPCSKELVSYMLSISKQKNPETGEVLAMRVPLLEKQVVSLILEAVRESSGADPKSEMVWSNLSSLLIYFMLYKVRFHKFLSKEHKSQLALAPGHT